MVHRVRFWRLLAWTKNGKSLPAIHKESLEHQNILVAHDWRVLRYTLTDVRDRLDDVEFSEGPAEFDALLCLVYNDKVRKRNE